MKDQNKSWFSIVVILLGLAFASGARAEESIDSAQEQHEPHASHSGQNALERRADMGLVFGAKLGGGLGLGPFGASLVTELEVGYLLPLLSQSIELFFTAQYMQPRTDDEVSEIDPRLPGDGLLRYEVTQQILPLTFGALYRLPLPTDVLMPYAAAGARLYMLRTEVSGSGGGEAFGSNEETTSKLGAYFAVGTDIFLGPGALLAELQLNLAPVDEFVLRDTNASALNLAIGYRLML